MEESMNPKTLESRDAPTGVASKESHRRRARER